MTQLTRAVLWDMDGTLIDSHEYHWQAWRETMAAVDRPITFDQFAATFGWRNDTILRAFYGFDLPPGEVDRIGGVKEERYRELVRARGIDLLPGAGRWLDRLKAAGWRQAVASSAPRANIDAILNALKLDHFFDALVSAEDVQRGKPDPQVFLTAAERVGVPPPRCVVVEDAPAGIEGAHRAGMRAIGVLTTHADLPGDRVVHTLDQLDDGAFDELVR
jgi:beta-phosphoglucomutase